MRSKVTCDRSVRREKRAADNGEVGDEALGSWRRRRGVDGRLLWLMTFSLLYDDASLRCWDRNGGS